MIDENQLIAEIAREISLIRDQIRSRHLDEICPNFPIHGKKLNYWIDEFFPKLKEALSASDQTLLVVTVPFRSTKSARSTSPKLSTAPDYHEAFPSIYLLEAEIGVDDFMSEAADEILIEISSSDQSSCLFRSWRDMQSKSKGWEFNNAVYIWSRL